MLNTASPPPSCSAPIPAVEAFYRIPHGLLRAIAQVESRHHPWALNVAGQAIFPPTARNAARLLRDADGRPRRDVAIGCMQISMRYHLAGWGAPEWALSPAANVRYAGFLLAHLRVRYGTWPAAIAYYHASAPAPQRRYLALIAAALRDPAPFPPGVAPPTRTGPSATSRPATGRPARASRPRPSSSAPARPTLR